MPGILGLQDSEAYAADRFQNWRRTILYTFPNGAAPLTALLSLIKSEDTNEAVFNWHEKSLPTQRAELTAAYTNVATSIAVDAKTFRAGHIIMNEITGEVMKVTAVDATGLVLTVLRGEWGTAVASNGVDDPIIIIGNSNPEGGEVPGIITFEPTRPNNFTQIFRTPFGVTGTALKTSLRYDRSGPYVERVREALNLHSIEMEKAFIWGKKAEFVDPGTGFVERTTDGVVARLPASNIIDVPGGVLTAAFFEETLELAFRVCLSKSNEKLILCGSTFLSVVNRLAEVGGHLNTVPGEDSFGMKLVEWITPHGVVYFRSHPLFTQHPVWRRHALILDIHGLRYRPLIDRDTAKLTNRQNPGADKRIDEFLTECGLEFQHPEAHVLLRGAATTVAP